DWLDLFNLSFCDIHGIADDDLVAALASTCRSPVQNAAAGPAHPIDDVGADAGAGVLVPDIHEFHGQDARGFAVVGVQGNGTMIFQVGTGDADTMQFAADNFSHFRFSIRGFRLIL